MYGGSRSISSMHLYFAISLRWNGQHDVQASLPGPGTLQVGDRWASQMSSVCVED